MQGCLVVHFFQICICPQTHVSGTIVLVVVAHEGFVFWGVTYYMLVINLPKLHVKGTGTCWGILEIHFHEGRHMGSWGGVIVTPPPFSCNLLSSNPAYPWTCVHSNRNTYNECRILNLLIFPREDSGNTLLLIGILNTNKLYLKWITNNKDVSTHIYYT